MRVACNEVVPRLVAWQDGELSRSEATQLEEHVAGCASCARAHHRLALTLPMPPLPPPARLRRRLAAALDVDAILAAAEQPEEPAPAAPSWASWCWRSFARPSSVPYGAVLAYLALLAATFGWGASNWWALQQADSTATAAPSRAVGGRPGTATGEIPAHQFRPAAYDPEVDGSMSGERRDPVEGPRTGDPVEGPRPAGDTPE
jgi:anti-sigma factor RsiW